VKRLILASVASVMALSFIGVASASAAPNGASTHYTAGPFYGATPGANWTCAGNRIVSNGAGTKDVESCLISGDTSGYVAGTYKSDPKLGVGVGGPCNGLAVGFIPFINELLGIPTNQVACWYSDFDGAGATKWTLTFADNGTSPDTWTLSIVAYYNS
jgi:hypothetical protein